MGIIDNRRRVGARLSFESALFLLLAAAVMLPRVQAQDKGPPPPAENAPAGVKDAGLAKQADGWGPGHDGLRTRLVPAQEEYVVGQPARFRLEMKNFGEHDRAYDRQQVDCNDSMRVSDQDGKPVRYVAGGSQTAGHAKSIAPGETVVLFDKLDLATQYLFIKPGSYTLQFRGLGRTPALEHLMSKSAIPPSNTIAVEMRPGTLPASTRVAARLIEILPEKWGLSLNQTAYGGVITVPGWEPGRGMELWLIRSNSKRDWLSADVWVAEHKLVWTGKVKEPFHTAVYLGKGIEGHVYWIVPEKAEAEWPDIRTKIKAVLLDKTVKEESELKSGERQ